MVFGALIGVAAGLGVVGFYTLIDISHFLFIKLPERRLPSALHVLYQPVLTALGVWAAWLLVRRSRIVDGQNVPDVQRAVAKHGGAIDGAPVAVRTLASAFTLGSGGSAGSEGPVAVLGAALGSSLGRKLRFQPRHLKILVGCGAAAGIAGAFNAPIAGAFFALEEVLGSFSVGAFSPVVIASVVGALTVRPFLGSHPIFAMAPLREPHPVASALLFPLLGMACGLASALYSRMYLAGPRFFRSLPGPEWLHPLIGGALTGLIVLGSRGLLAGDGHLAIPASVFGGMAWYLLIALALAKLVATVVTLGSGGSGGVFTPTLFIGAALGGGLGVLGEHLAPSGFVHAHVWALVGMAGMVAGATRAPLTAIFMVFEMTDDYGYVIPLMIVAVIAFVTARRFAPHGLYDGWLAGKGEHLSHGADRALMDRLHVREALVPDAEPLMPGASLSEVTAMAARSRRGVLAVLDVDGSVLGLIDQHAMREAVIARGEGASMLLAMDLAEPAEGISPRASLREALSVMNARGLDELPVIESSEQGGGYIGLLSRADILAAYEKELAHAV